MHLFARSISLGKKINWRLVIALILGYFLAVTPAWVQANTTAPIILNGENLFEVNSSGEFDAQQRARDANSILGQLDFTQGKIEVEIDQSTEIPVIRVNGNHLLSVTSEDLPKGRSPMEQALAWSRQLEQGIQDAKKEYTPQYLLEAGLRALGSVLGAIAIMFGLKWVCHRKLKPLWLQDEISSEEKTSQPINKNIEVAVKVILNIINVAISFFTLGYVTRLFPQTRQLSRTLVDTVTTSLISDVIPLGSKSYSILDLLILTSLFTGVILVSRTLRKLLRSRVLSLTPLNPGAREAITTIFNYTFIFISTVILLQLWGLDLSSLTVFAGILGVGIGFGLQGIAKEFISGIIIIFERPIQVGDFVEVDNLMGTVKYINVRSTEIITLDQISIIVPNSRFLESEVINWSHRSSISRIKIPVGVAYGSDLTTVRTTLIQAAKEHSDVLMDPSPKVAFMGFGESAVNFNLLIWIKEPRKQLLIKSDIYFRIETMFRHRHIDIPFPQRDLHVRSGNMTGGMSPDLQDSLTNLSNSLAAWLEHQSKD